MEKDRAIRESPRKGYLIGVEMWSDREIHQKFSVSKEEESKVEKRKRTKRRDAQKKIKNSKNLNCGVQVSGACSVANYTGSLYSQ